jgi:hypothetical protein
MQGTSYRIAAPLLLAVLAFSGILAGCGSGQTEETLPATTPGTTQPGASATSTSTKTATAITAPPPTIVNGIPRVTPQSLSAQWQSNPIAADYYYKGKTVQVVGTITTFYKTGMLGFDMTGGNITVACNSFISIDHLLPLAIGQTVIVQGTCQGIQGKGPQLTACSIVP